MVDGPHDERGMVRITVAPPPPDVLKPTALFHDDVKMHTIQEALDDGVTPTIAFPVSNMLGATADIVVDLVSSSSDEDLDAGVTSASAVPVSNMHGALPATSTLPVDSCSSFSTSSQPSTKRSRMSTKDKWCELPSLMSQDALDMLLDKSRMYKKGTITKGKNGLSDTFSSECKDKCGYAVKYRQSGTSYNVWETVAQHTCAAPAPVPRIGSPPAGVAEARPAVASAKPKRVSTAEKWGAGTTMTKAEWGAFFNPSRDKFNRKTKQTNKDGTTTHLYRCKCHASRNEPPCTHEIRYKKTMKGEPRVVQVYGTHTCHQHKTRDDLFLSNWAKDRIVELFDKLHPSSCTVRTTAGVALSTILHEQDADCKVFPEAAFSQHWGMLLRKRFKQGENDVDSWKSYCEARWYQGKPVIDSLKYYQQNPHVNMCLTGSSCYDACVSVC